MLKQLYILNFFFSSTKVISHSCLFNKSIKDEEIKDLIDLGILIPYEEETNKKTHKIKSKENNAKYDFNYYKIIKFNNEGIDNTLNIPINNNDFFDNFYLDYLETSFSAFEKVQKVFNLFRHILEDEEAKDEDKFLFAKSEELFEFLVEIKNLTQHRLTECEKKDKFQQCQRCKEAIPIEFYDEHVKNNKCNEFKKNCNRCPLCHEDIPLSKDGFYVHLIKEKCPFKLKYKNVKKKLK
jgi:hypothetical protein